MNKMIVKKGAIVSSATLASRIFGFVRDIIIARFFGTGLLAEAFVVAYKLPNMLRSLVAEGAMQAAFIPTFSEYANKPDRKQELMVVISHVFKILCIILFVLTLIGIVFAPALVRLVAPGFDTGLDKYALTVRLTRLLFPYIFLISLAAFYSSILHTLKSFTAPSLGPLVQNMAIIVLIVFFTRGLGIDALVIGILLGGFLQCAIQIPALIARGVRFVKVKGLMHPAVKKIGTLMMPRILSAGVYQISTLVDTILASLAMIVGAGGVAAFYYGNRLIQLPLAVFGFAMSVVALPILSDYFVRNDKRSFSKTAFFALKSTLFFLLPASAGLMVLAGPIVKLLFQRGAFDAYSSAITTDVVLFYAIGLFAFGGSRICASCFFAMNDTKTPFKIACLSMTANIVLNVILMFPMKIAGIALATSLSNILNFVILLWILSRQNLMPIPDVIRFFVKVCGASLVMAGVLFIMMRFAIIDVLQADMKVLLFGVPVLIVSGILAYAITAHLFLFDEMKTILSRSGRDYQR